SIQPGGLGVLMLNLWVYKILKTKGSGGYADVHKAINRFNGQTVAIKELRLANLKTGIAFKERATCSRYTKTRRTFLTCISQFLTRVSRSLLWSIQAWVRSSNMLVN